MAFIRKTLIKDLVFLSCYVPFCLVFYSNILRVVTMYDDCRGAMEFEEDEWVRDDLDLPFLIWFRLMEVWNESVWLRYKIWK